MLRRSARSAVGLGAVVGSALLGSEFLHWQASRRGYGAGPGAEGPREDVIVLGYRDPGPRAHLINRSRVRAGLRSQGPGRSRLVLTGGAVAGRIPEAELMAVYARECGYSGELITETDSRSTRENIVNVIGLVGDAGRIKIVSSSLHGLQARRELLRQRPDLARRLVPAGDYRFGELILIKPLMVGWAVRRRFKLWRRARRSVGSPRPRTPDRA